ncbi:MAG: ATP-binding protein, partial [Kiritimatiellia bacterium]
ELCKDKIEPGHEIREWLDEIIQCSERSAEITRQLLAFARKQVIQPRIVDLNDAVGGMLKLLRRLLGEDITLVWQPGRGLYQVLIDPAQIDQILANLCVNGRDAIDGVGEIIIETGYVHLDADYCESHPDAIPGDYVCLSVSDDGCGMNEEDLAQVFEPFFTTKGVGKGTGLGLSTVYGIAKQNFGSVDASSEPGRGSTFRVYLQKVAAEVEETTVTPKTEAPRARGETILLVEDEKSLRVTCGLFLETLGYQVIVAETPAEALKLTARHSGSIHLLLTDVVMPGMDGCQLAKRISAGKSNLKVLFMSGYTSDVITRRGVLDEGMHFMSKPFTRDDLAHKVRELLDAPSRF